NRSHILNCKGLFSVTNHKHKLKPKNHSRHHHLVQQLGPFELSENFIPLLHFFQMKFETRNHHKITLENFFEMLLSFLYLCCFQPSKTRFSHTQSKLTVSLTARFFLTVYFGGPKIRPPGWPAKCQQKTFRVMDRFVLTVSNTTLSFNDSLKVKNN
ncbi:hypothetical protein BpHYR1_033284, partial [Brachionus plicatilis]